MNCERSAGFVKYPNDWKTGRVSTSQIACDRYAGDYVLHESQIVAGMGIYAGYDTVRHEPGSVTLSVPDDIVVEFPVRTRASRQESGDCRGSAHIAPDVVENGPAARTRPDFNALSVSRIAAEDGLGTKEVAIRYLNVGRSASNYCHRAKVVEIDMVNQAVGSAVRPHDVILVGGVAITANLDIPGTPCAVIYFGNQIRRALRGIVDLYAAVLGVGRSYGWVVAYSATAAWRTLLAVAVDDKPWTLEKEHVAEEKA